MSIKKWHIAGCVFVIIMGVVSHFAYDFFGNNTYAGYFFPVNESVWEHLKLIFWPAIYFMIPEYFGYGRRITDFFAVKMSALFCAMCTVVIFFYTYSGVLGFNLLAADVFSFFAAVLIYTYISLRLISGTGSGDRGDNIRGLAVLLLFALCFVFWTYNPPELGIFWG